VADLGCWPGGWLQVAAREVGPEGRVVGVDLAAVDPPLGIENVFSFVGDLGNPATGKEILARLGGPADVVLSDAAPKLTGVRAADRAREEALLEMLGALAPTLLRPGGGFLAKLLDCPEAEAFRRELAGGFEEARVLRTRASRKGSAERYLLLRSYRGGNRGRGGS
jgi:23S rRNA (uridine2552-2'-O)-methyltransferase